MTIDSGPHSQSLNTLGCSDVLADTDKPATLVGWWSVRKSTVRSTARLPALITSMLHFCTMVLKFTSQTS